MNRYQMTKYNCMFFSYHVRVSEWIHTLNFSYYFNLLLLFIFLASFCLRGINHEIKSRDKILEPRDTNKKKFLTQKIRTRENFGPTRKKFGHKKQPTRKHFEPTKYPWDKISDPQRQDGTMTRWHETHEIHHGTGSVEMIILFPILLNFSQLNQLAQANCLLIYNR